MRTHRPWPDSVAVKLLDEAGALTKQGHSLMPGN